MRRDDIGDDKPAAEPQFRRGEIHRRRALRQRQMLEQRIEQNHVQRRLRQRLNLRLSQDFDLRIGRMALAQRRLNLRRRIVKIEPRAMFGDQRCGRRFAAAIIEHRRLRRGNLRRDRLGDVVIIGGGIAAADATGPTAAK